MALIKCIHEIFEKEKDRYRFTALKFPANMQNCRYMSFSWQLGVGHCSQYFHVWFLSSWTTRQKYESRTGEAVYFVFFSWIVAIADYYFCLACTSYKIAYWIPLQFQRLYKQVYSYINNFSLEYWGYFLFSNINIEWHIIGARSGYRHLRKEINLIIWMAYHWRKLFSGYCFKMGY